MADILNEDRCIGFFEVHAENDMGKGGTARVALEHLRRRDLLQRICW